MAGQTAHTNGVERRDRVSTSTPAKAAASKATAKTAVKKTSRKDAFGEKLRELRGESGMSQAALARSAGISPGYIGLIEVGERGERPSVDICRRLSQALHLDIEQHEDFMRAAGHLMEGESWGPKEGGPGLYLDVEDAIVHEKRLTHFQRESLLNVYRAFLGRPD